MGGSIPGGNFSGGIFQGGVWWVGIVRVEIFPGEIFLEPFNRVSSWSHDQTLWKIQVKKFDFSDFAGITSAASVRTEHFHRHILIGLALI